MKIVTPSTNSVIPILERQKVTEFLTGISSLAQMAALDPTGQMAKKITDAFRIDEVVEWMADAYGYDIDSLKANTKKDEIRKENLKKIETLKQLLTPQQNAPQQTGPVPGVAPGLPQ